jgi:hypothetical protein
MEWLVEYIPFTLLQVRHAFYKGVTSTLDARDASNTTPRDIRVSTTTTVGIVDSVELGSA